MRVDGVLRAATGRPHPQRAALPQRARVLLAGVLRAVAVVAAPASGEHAARTEHEAAGEAASDHLPPGQGLLQPGAAPIPFHHAVLLSRES